MLQSTRAWLRRNRTPLALGAGLLSTAYLTGTYALSKFHDARAAAGEARVAKENLRRRFEQNQEDCAFTVLAILPTATEGIVEALPVERVVGELQGLRARRLGRSAANSEGASEAMSVGGTETEDGSASVAADGEGYVHASRVGLESETGETGGQEAGRASKKSKAQLWDEMKISSITRAFTLLYTIALLTLLTRIQLNLLGRRNYLASVVSLAAPPAESSSRITLENNDDDNEDFDHAYGNDFETNRRYLSLSWWLLHRGCLELLETVRTAVTDVFAHLNPRDEISLETLSELTLEVRRRIEGATEEDRRTRKWLPYLLPPPEQESFVLAASGMPPSPTTPASTSLRRLIDETSDLADSPAFTRVLTRLLDSAFSHLIDTKISAGAYKIPPVSGDTGRVVEIVGGGDGVMAKVASSLAVFCRQAHAIGAGVGNEYLEKMEQVGELEAFAAVVYSSNFEFESAAGADAVSGKEGEEGGFESAWDKAVAQ
ncbi:Peroxin-3 [Boeremia exigua]|uniref:Peroxin-3 n=1 Tax=Boeremia exigua TaxID=749465 RepID=UPI001E8CBD02|nr:Peroxin-3 [Boeremia exigua]KAH6622058.1 Peroxin-3 [Boeremia exigua]